MTGCLLRFGRIGSGCVPSNVGLVDAYDSDLVWFHYGVLSDSVVAAAVSLPGPRVGGGAVGVGVAGLVWLRQSEKQMVVVAIESQREH